MLLMLCWCRETNYQDQESSGAPWKPINGHQGREAGGAISRLPNTPPRQQDMDRESILRKLDPKHFHQWVAPVCNQDRC